MTDRGMVENVKKKNAEQALMVHAIALCISRASYAVASAPEAMAQLGDPAGFDDEKFTTYAIGLGEALDREAKNIRDILEQHRLRMADIE